MSFNHTFNHILSSLGAKRHKLSYNYEAKCYYQLQENDDTLVRKKYRLYVSHFLQNISSARKLNLRANKILKSLYLCGLSVLKKKSRVKREYGSFKISNKALWLEGRPSNEMFNKQSSKICHFGILWWIIEYAFLYGRTSTDLTGIPDYIFGQLHVCASSSRYVTCSNAANCKQFQSEFWGSDLLDSASVCQTQLFTTLWFWNRLFHVPNKSFNRKHSLELK